MLDLIPGMSFYSRLCAGTRPPLLSYDISCMGWPNVYHGPTNYMLASNCDEHWVPFWVLLICKVLIYAWNLFDESFFSRALYEVLSFNRWIKLINLIQRLRYRALDRPLLYLTLEK